VYSSEELKEFSLEQLFTLIKGRKESMQEGSYTSYLFASGIDKILKKVGEECTEVIIGAKNSKEEAVFEIADLTYHVLVLMAQMGIESKDILNELAKRHVVDKKVKQQKMK
jgi:phosphoribosyl-ATP pyrophosphohydrolase/phosphoribosyl-AMP cyclohydrolase